MVPSEWHTVRLSISDGQSDLAPSSAPPGQTIWLEESAIGCLICEPDTPSPGTLWIAVLIIHPEHRLQGYGREIVEGLFTFAKRIQLNVDAADRGAVRFWKSLGFVSSTETHPAKAAPHGLLLERISY